MMIGIFRQNIQTERYFSKHRAARRKWMLLSLAHQSFLLVIILFMMVYLVNNQPLLYVLYEEPILARSMVGFSIFCLFYLFCTRDMRRRIPINYTVYLSYGVSYAVMLLLLSIEYGMKMILGIVVNVCCLMVCLLVFTLVTRIDIDVKRFMLAIIVMTLANTVIISLGSNRPWGETAMSSVVSCLYATHYMHRLDSAVRGYRLDVTMDDYIYGGVINYMDVPFYLLGWMQYLLPIAQWTGMNTDFPDRKHE